MMLLLTGKLDQQAAVMKTLVSWSWRRRRRRKRSAARAKDTASDPGPGSDAPPFRPSIQEAGVLSHPVP